ncbi:TPA_asm: hp [Altiarchaeum virus]|nr:TPA_asm: hp [Altiarchaeum virus]
MTPHNITIVDAGGNVKRTIKSDGVARLKAMIERSGDIDGVPTSKTVFGTLEGLPSQQEGVFFVVSQIIKSAYPQRTDLLVPAELIRDKEGVILGCQSLGV